MRTLSQPSMGKKLFTPCSACHTVEGSPAAGTIGPNLTHVGGRSTLFAGIRDGFAGPESADVVQRELERWISTLAGGRNSVDRSDAMHRPG